MLWICSECYHKEVRWLISNIKWSTCSLWSFLYLYLMSIAVYIYLPGMRVIVAYVIIFFISIVITNMCRLSVLHVYLVHPYRAYAPQALFEWFHKWICRLQIPPINHAFWQMACIDTSSATMREVSQTVFHSHRAKTV